MSILITLLVALIVLAIVFAIVRAILPLLGLGEPFNTIIYLVCLIIALVVVLNLAGFGGGTLGLWHGRCA